MSLPTPYNFSASRPKRFVPKRRYGVLLQAHNNTVATSSPAELHAMGTLVCDIYACATRAVDYINPGNSYTIGNSIEDQLGVLRLDQQRAVLLRTVYRLRRLEEYACCLRYSLTKCPPSPPTSGDETDLAEKPELSDALFLRSVVGSYPYRHQMMDRDVDWAWLAEGQFQGLTHLEARKRVREAVISLGRVGEWVRYVVAKKDVKADDVFGEFVWSEMEDGSGSDGDDGSRGSEADDNMSL